MSEELLEFRNTVEDPDGRSHVARVMGAERNDGTWIGWIRFTAPNGETIETERETTQPNRDDLSYWSRGLTYFYLEGALRRASRLRDQRLGGKVSGDGEPDPAAAGSSATD